MKFKVTEIDFDLTENFNDRDQLFGEYIDTEMLASQLQRAYTKTSWDADDLLEQISDASGWRINSIQYEEIK
jgi:hypothetical protein